MSQLSPIPAAYAWPALLAKDGDSLFDHYRHALEDLCKQPGTLALTPTAASAMEPWPGTWRHRHPALGILGG